DGHDAARSGRVEQAEAVVSLADHTVVVPAQPEVECDATAGLEAVLDVEAPAVLGGVAVRVAARGAAAAGDAGDEALEVVEAQLAAVARVEELVDRGPAVVHAELPVVAPGVVGHVGEALVVDVGAA